MVNHRNTEKKEYISVVLWISQFNHAIIKINAIVNSNQSAQ